MNTTLIVSRNVLLLCFLCFFISTSAQISSPQIETYRKNITSDNKVKTVEFSDQRQTPSFISLKSAKDGYSKDQARLALDNYLQVRNGVDALIAAKETSLPDNMKVIEFQQYFKGVKVEYASYKALVKNNQVRFFNGAWYHIPAGFSVQPKLAQNSALDKAKRRIGARKYVTDVFNEELAKTKDSRQKEAIKSAMREASPKGDLVIVKDFTKEGVAQLKLAYKFDIYAAEPLSRDWVYIDATDGNVLLLDPIIKHTNPNPPSSTSTAVKTRYAGTRNIFVKQISGNDPNSGLPIVSSHPTSEPTYIPGTNTWALIDDTRGNGIETYDLNGQGGLPLSISAFYTQGKSFTDVDNNWSLAEHKRSGTMEGGAFEAENDDIAWDAHWGAEMVYDYWKLKQNRLSYDGNNAKIKSFVHYGPAYDNAFWNGSAMTYGDGSGPDAEGFRALTSLDVCGHEIGHGVCEFTANLVYQKESGAMNEAFSDIWAACVEHYVITTIDPSLASVYRPFYIGEQISATPDAPLRRMDNPKATRNPDTYGGTNWRNPDCSPDLTNDYCGVHNNSGLLNKWFYLITVGSGAGSGPDAKYARPDSDDGVNDAVTNNPKEGTHGANTYSVTGLGFNVSERISYLTELLLTSTATYQEARQVSIAVATEFSGNPCSALVESVTNAWYAIGVGGQFVKPCTITYGFTNPAGLSVSEGNSTIGCFSQKTYEIAVLVPANGTANIATSGTAVKGKDFTISATSVKNPTTQISKKTFTVTVLNDASIEANETVIITLSMNNTGTNPVNSTFTLNILDDDVTPVIGTTEKTLLTETFTRADGFAELPGWTEVFEIPESPNGDPLATGKNQWGIFGNKLAVTGKEGTTGITQPNGTYNSASESKSYVKMPMIDARGLSVIKVKFDYRVQGEVDVLGLNPLNPDIENLPVFDYMALMYSFDGVNFVELTTGDFRQFASAAPAQGTITGTLPAAFGNKQFYLAFRWSNDANAGGPESVQIDNLLITGAPKKIENDFAHGGSEVINIRGDVYFYSTQDGEVVGRLVSGSTTNFGCTNFSVEKAGSSTFSLYTEGSNTNVVSDKVIRIQPANNLNGPNTIYFYYSETQLVAIEKATGKGRADLTIYQTEAGNFTGASNSNTTKFKPVYTAIEGVGGYYKISTPNSNRLMASYSLGATIPTSAVIQGSPAARLSQSAASDAPVITDWSFEKVYPNPGNGNFTFNVTAPQAQRVHMQVINMHGQVMHYQNERLQVGSNLIKMNLRNSLGGSYLMYIKNEKGEVINTQQFVIK